MKSKKIATLAMAAVMTASMMATPAAAMSIVPQKNMSCHLVDGWYVVNPTHYSHEDYTTTLAGMAERQLAVYGMDTSDDQTPVAYTDVIKAITDTLGCKYRDVDKSHTDAVNWAVARGITKGTGAYMFSPDATVTRAQAVTFLWRAAGSPAVSNGNPFKDVASDAYYTQAVQWAVANNITSGTSKTTFSPDTTCSRAQIVTMLYRAEGAPAVGRMHDINDVKANAYYRDAVDWALDNDIAGYTGNHVFSPDAVCPRGDMVKFLRNANRGAVAHTNDVATALANLGYSKDLLSPASIGDTFTAGDLALLTAAIIDTYDVPHTVIGAEVGTPDTIMLTANSAENAEGQIAAALKFAPDTIKVTFTGNVDDSTISKFAAYHKDWKDKHQIPLFLNAINTTSQNPITVSQSGRTVTFGIQYTDSWYALADIWDWYRCYEDKDYSKWLVDYVDTYLEPIAQQNLSRHYATKAAYDVILTLADYDDDALTDMRNGVYSNIEVHSLAGLRHGKLVCDGFASAAQFANNYLGNDCFIVRQAHSDGNSHLWAKVNIDGGWYNTDLSEDFGYPADPNEGATERMLYYFGDEGGISGTYSVPYAAQPLVQDWYRSLYPSTEDYDYRNNR